MFRGNSAVDNPVIAEDSATVLGFVDGCLLDPLLSRIAAFTLQQTSDNELIILPWMGIKRFEANRVIAWTSAMIVQANELFDIRRLINQGGIEPSTRLCTTDSKFLGTVSDFFFDEQSGTVTHYEVIGGPFASNETGLAVIPAFEKTVVEKATNTAYLPQDYAKLAHLIENSS